MTQVRSNLLPVAAAFLAAAFLAAACAVPVAPVGGPTDSAPPRLAEVAPADGTTNADGARLRFTFDEYVNEASFARAFSMTPEPDIPPTFSWRRRTVSVRLRSPLRENTTYRITIGRELRDANNVALREPIVTAFSTGPTINKASLLGMVVDGFTGRGVSGFDIFAYEYPGPSSDTIRALPERPLYRTQTDDGGRFRLTYLAEGSYYLVGVGDANGNRRLDAGERVAVPRRSEARASETDPDSLVLVASLHDDVAPELRRAVATSATRYEAQFSEPVYFDGPPTIDGWSLTDSLRSVSLDIRRAYVSAENQATVVLVTATVPDPPTRIRLTTGAVRDSVGNTTSGLTAWVAPTTRADTTRTRVLAVRPSPPPADTIATLVRDQPVFVEVNESANPDSFVTFAARSSAPIDFSWSTLDGRSYSLLPSVPLETEVIVMTLQMPERGIVGSQDQAPDPPDEALDDLSAEASTIADGRFIFRLLREGELGDVAGTVDADATNVVVEVVRLSDLSDVRRAVVGVDGSFRVAGLRPGRYVLRTFVDVDGDGRWTPGTIAPWSPGEPIRWATDSLDVRARFESVLPDTLTFLPDP